MEKIICRGRGIDDYGIDEEQSFFELKTPTAEEVARLEDGQEVLIYRKISNAAYYKKGGFNDYNDDKIAYILPKTEQKDELDNLKFGNEKYAPIMQVRIHETVESIMDKFDKLIDIIKELKERK